ncbi:hypothetical protein BpHYR1_000260 [Brachionus plicatilis]|uniref:Uncharacterized protein n=1 Tax=Brachionus plicatilis TaxID=10195 RepID=A0A3M7RJ07_BRAPC|nr:hypothetical protein BpHYR1_000260 [Brachionus plicatilis]
MFNILNWSIPFCDQKLVTKYSFNFNWFKILSHFNVPDKLCLKKFSKLDFKDKRNKYKQITFK